jgi:hypothetical protein
MKLVYTIPLVLLLATTALFAQSLSDKKYFYTRQECAPASEMMKNVVIDYGEQALFTGAGLTIGYEGEPFTGGSMFFVNQDSGTWSLLTLYGDGTACMTAAGTDFEPFGG